MPRRIELPGIGTRGSIGRILRLTKDLSTNQAKVYFALTVEFQPRISEILMSSAIFHRDLRTNGWPNSRFAVLFVPEREKRLNHILTSSFEVARVGACNVTGNQNCPVITGNRAVDVGDIRFDANGSGSQRRC